MGISVLYHALEREDMDLVQRTLDRTGDHRVPVPPSIKSEIAIHSAVGNFDKSDDKGGSHDIILMFFQNPPQVPSENLIMSSKPEDVLLVRKLPHELPCQELIESNRGLARGTIPNLYMASEQLNTDKPWEDYPIWTLARYVANNSIDIENEIEKLFPRLVLLIVF